MDRAYVTSLLFHAAFQAVSVGLCLVSLMSCASSSIIVPRS